MKHKRTAIYFMSILLLTAAVYFGILAKDQGPPFSFAAVSDYGTEEILPWEKAEGEYYVFLPGYGDLSQVRIRTRKPVQLNGIKMTYGMSCENLELEKAYPFTAPEGQGTVTFLRAARLPAMYINTASGSVEEIHKKKGNAESGSLRVYNADGSLNYLGGFESLSIHGNGFFDKMPYDLKLANEGDLLSMGKAKKWILLSNANDDSNLRNKMVYDFAADAGLAYSPDCRWVDVYVNGDYRGLYLLSERNEIHPERVALADRGSFLLSHELRDRLDEQEIPYIQTEAEASMRIRGSTMPTQELFDTFQSAENAVLAEDGIDPGTGKHWRELIDLDSWTKKYIIEEVFGNVDGGRVSQFFYLDGGDPEGKIHAGPVWDYDMAMGNPRIYELPVPNMFYVNPSYEDQGSPWFHKLYQDEEFYDHMVETYAGTILPLLEKLLNEKFDRYLDAIDGSARMSQLRWSRPDFREDADNIKNYLIQHRDFLSGVWLENREIIMVRGRLFFRRLNFALSPGDLLPELPEYEGYSWYPVDSDVPIDRAQPVCEPMEIVLRADQAAQPETPHPQKTGEPFHIWITALLAAGVLLGLMGADHRRNRKKEYERCQTPQNSVMN